MKRVSKLLLLGILFAATAASVCYAQEPVSITGVNASLVGDSVVIELQTTTAANFVLEHADGDSWLFVWCDGFMLDTSVGDIPLDFGITSQGDLLEGAALAASGKRSGLSILLGPKADAARAFVVNGDRTSTITIPALSILSPDLSRGSIPVIPSYAEFPTETGVVEVRAREIPIFDSPSTREMPEEVGFEIKTATSRAIEISAVEQDIQAVEIPVADIEIAVSAVEPSVEVDTLVHVEPSVTTEPSFEDPFTPTHELSRRFEFKPARLDWNNNSSQSFPMPGTVGPMPEATDVTLSKSVELPVEIATPEPSFREQAKQIDDIAIPNQKDFIQDDVAFALSPSTTNGIGEAAEINYQYLPERSPEDNSGGDMPEFGEALEKLAEELLKNAGQINDGTVENGTSSSLATPNGNLYGQYQSQAMLSDNGHVNRGLGKDDLSQIRIDLFEIVDTPLDQAITLLIAPTDFNVIVDAEVGTNKISLSFKDKQTDLKSALDLITKVYGLKYVVEAGTIVVADKEKMAQGLLAAEPRMFILSFADPASVKNILINTGLVAETHIEVYTGEASYLDVNDSTTLSTESQSATQEVKPIESNLSSSPRNVLLVMAPAEEMIVIAKVISDLDRKPKLIELEVRVCEASENALRDLGISINNNAGTPTPTVTLFTETLNENGIIESQSIGSFHRSPLNLVATLNTLMADGKVEVLAQPTLTTVDGKQAIYFAGERVPYISKVSQSTSGQQIEVDFLNIGVTLNFKPRLDSDGMLTIDVNPIVSSLLEFRLIGQLVEAPRTSSRQMATTVRVASGEPFVLAGLIAESERTTITKVPLLGDLPLLGKLFRNKNHKGERTEIIVVVTPVVTDR